MDRQTLRDWVHRYNESGSEGLYDRPRRNGPRPRLSAEQQAKVVEWVEQGSTLSVMAWCVAPRRSTAAHQAGFCRAMHERTVGKLLRKLSSRRLSVRPQHPQSKPEEQAVFKAASLIS
jgi:transposase